MGKLGTTNKSNQEIWFLLLNQPLAAQFLGIKNENEIKICNGCLIYFVLFADQRVLHRFRPCMGDLSGPKAKKKNTSEAFQTERIC